MKLLRIYFFIVLVGVVYLSHGQNSMGVGTTTPNSNAVLELVSPTNDQGFLVPRLTTAQRTDANFLANLSVVDKGLMVFDSDENQFYFWDGTEWVTISTQTTAFTAGDGIAISPEGEIQNLGDLSDTNELLDTTNTGFDGTILSLADAGGIISLDLSSLSDGDNQDLELTGNTLTLTNDGTSVDLGAFLDNTDEQDLSLSSNVLSLSNDPSPVDLSGFLDNTDSQTLALSGTDLTITGGNTVNVASLNTDNQELSFNQNELSISGGTNIVDLSLFLDNTDQQTLSLTGTDLSIQDGNVVSLASLIDDADASPTNEIQDLQLVGNVLSITNNGSATPINLAPFAGTNTDEQTLSLTGTDLSITGGNTISVASLQDGFEANTDNQTLSLVGTDLTISGGNTVSVASLQDGFEANTDNQTLSLVGTDLTISGGNTVNVASLNTDNQDLELAGNNLTLTNDATLVDLSGYLDNTDAQTLSVGGGSLTISGGNSIELALLGDGFEANTDNQTLSLVGTDLTIAGGNTVSVASLNTDNQDLELAGNNLTLTNDATPVDLSGYLDNTDQQSLSLVGTDLTISGGNTVSVASLQDGFEANTDNQTLSLVGTDLTISGGNTVSVASLQDGFEANTDNQTLSLVGTNLTISGGNTVNVASLQDGTGTDDQVATEVPVTIQNGVTSNNVQLALEELQSEIDGITPGETNTASNTGAGGVGVFRAKNGVNLEFRNVNAGSNKISITDDSANGEIDIDVVDANLAISSAQVSGLGTAAALNVGTGANNILQLDGLGRLPSVDGSQLTNLPSSPWTENAGNVYRSSGSVGIGTTSLYNELNVVGTDNTVNGEEGIFVDVVNGSSTANTISGIRFKRNSVTANQRFNGGILYDGNSLFFATKTNATTTNINTSDADLEIDVNGNVVANNNLSVAGSTQVNSINASGTITASGTISTTGAISANNLQSATVSVSDGLTNNLNPMVTLNRSGGGSSATAMRFQNSTSYLGIGLTSTNLFAISGLGQNIGLTSDIFRINGDGKVAIGVGASPSGSYQTYIRIPNTDAITRYGVRLEHSYSGTSPIYGYYTNMNGSSTASRYGVYIFGETANYFSADLGIGTTSPSAKLDVVGDAEFNGSISTPTGSATTIFGALGSGSVLNASGKSVIKIRSTSTDRWIDGINGGVDGQELKVICVDAVGLINFKRSTSPLGGGSDIYTPVGLSVNKLDVVNLIYVDELGGWLVTSVESNTSDIF